MISHLDETFVVFSVHETSKSDRVGKSVWNGLLKVLNGDDLVAVVARIVHGVVELGLRRVGRPVVHDWGDFRVQFRKLAGLRANIVQDVDIERRVIETGERDTILESTGIQDLHLILFDDLPLRVGARYSKMRMLITITFRISCLTGRCRLQKCNWQDHGCCPLYRQWLVEACKLPSLSRSATRQVARTCNRCTILQGCLRSCRAMEGNVCINTDGCLFWPCQSKYLKLINAAGWAFVYYRRVSADMVWCVGQAQESIGRWYRGSFTWEHVIGIMRSHWKISFYRRISRS